MESRYLLFSAQDFANDDYFWRWVTEPDAQSNTFWENFLHNHPYKKEELENARSIVEALNQPTYQLGDEKVDAIWQDIRKNNPDLIESEQEPAIQLQAPVARSRSFYAYRVAAAVAGILLVAFLSLFVFQPHNQTITTAFGETKTVVLPDNSEVILNANTEISYHNNWQEQKAQREVWIEGEAYFSVRHLQDDKKFTVFSNGVKVEVLGTEFTVNNRRKKTQVVLNKGKVNFVVENNEKSPQQVTMAPGDLVEYASGEASLKQTVVNPDKYAAWTNNKLVFESATLQEISRVLEDNYGLTVQTKDKTILQKKFTGTVPTDDITILFQGLSRMHNLNINLKGAVITIESREKR